MPEIKELWAFVAVDADGDEGVLKREQLRGALPMIACSRDLLEEFRQDAERIIRGAPVALGVAHFVRVEI